jgi:enoyl-CoA hydratase
MKFPNLKIRILDCVAELTISRPDSLNSLNDSVLFQLESMIQELEIRDDVRVLVITGESRSFVSGADISHMASLDSARFLKFIQVGNRVLSCIENSRLPVIAAINGFAFGGGCELALACDLRMASHEALIGLPEVGLGLIPGFGGTQRLARLCGMGTAKDLIFSGRKLPAQEALALGLLNSVHTGNELLKAAHDRAVQIAAQSPFAVAVAKRLITRSADVELPVGLENELAGFARCISHKDCREGLQAYFDKRRPNWSASKESSQEND